MPFSYSDNDVFNPDDVIEGQSSSFTAAPFEESSVKLSAISQHVIKEQYHHFPDTQATACCLTLFNGFHFIGKSIGQNGALAEVLAYDHAAAKVKAYLLSGGLN